MSVSNVLPGFTSAETITNETLKTYNICSNNRLVLNAVNHKSCRLQSFLLPNNNKLKCANAESLDVVQYTKENQRRKRKDSDQTA